MSSYSPLSDSSVDTLIPRSIDGQAVNNESLELLAFKKPSWEFQPSQHTRSRKLLIVNLILFSASLIILFVALLVINPTLRQTCSQEIAWSPILDAVPVQSVKFNETFGFPTKYPSIFQGKPSKEVDDAWERFTKHPMLDGRSGRLGVPFSAVARVDKAANKDWLDSAVKLDDNKYMANLELFHNAHCLNMLRKLIYPEYYGTNVAAMTGHLEHCAESIRQAIFCNSGTGLVTFHWVEGMKEPYSDYNTIHQCRDPEAVLEWTLSNAVSTPAEGIRRAGGEKELSEHPE